MPEPHAEGLVKFIKSDGTIVAVSPDNPFPMTGGSGGGSGDVGSGSTGMLAVYTGNGTTVAGSFNDPAFKKYNVLAYTGADPTGAANQAATFQEAVDAVPDFGTLVIPDGIYKFTCPNTTNGAAVTISHPIRIKISSGATLLATGGVGGGSWPSDIRGIFKIMSDDVTIIGGKWDQNVANLAVASTIALINVGKNDYTTYRRIRIKHARFYNVSGCGVDMDNASQFYLEDCKFMSGNTTYVNIYRNGQSHEDVVVRRNYLDMTTIGPTWQIGINYSTGDTAHITRRFLIDDNEIDAGSNTNQHAIGIQVFCTGDVTLEEGSYYDGQICRNRIRGFLGGGLGGAEAISAVNLNNVAIFGNTVSKCYLGIEAIGVGLTLGPNNIDCKDSGGFAGILIDGYASNTVCIANIVKGLEHGNTGIYALHPGCSYIGNQCLAPFGNTNIVVGFKIYKQASGQGVPGQQFVGNRVVLGGNSYPVHISDCGDILISGANHFEVELATNPVLTLANPATFGTETHDHIFIDKSNTLRGGSSLIAISGTHWGNDVGWELRDDAGSITRFNVGWNGNKTGSTAPGTVTQSTDKFTAIATSNIGKLSITMNNAALAAQATATFDWPNSLAVAGARVKLSHLSGGTVGAYALNGVLTNGHVSVAVTNISGASKSEAIVISAELER